MKGVIWLKVLIFSDLHGSYINKLPKEKPDVVFILGDLTWNEVRKIDTLYTCPKLGVLGNHDRPDLFDGTSIVNMHRKSIDFQGFNIAGFGGSPTYNNREYGQYREAEVSKFIRSLDKPIDIFLAHSNPQFSPSLNMKDSHRGFSSFTTLIEKHKPSYFLHGHLHENFEKKYLKTKIICIHGYSYVQISFLSK